jgi:hypothetical protein
MPILHARSAAFLVAICFLLTGCETIKNANSDEPPPRIFSLSNSPVVYLKDGREMTADSVQSMGSDVVRVKTPTQGDYFFNPSEILRVDTSKTTPRKIVVKKSFSDDYFYDGQEIYSKAEMALVLSQINHKPSERSFKNYQSWRLASNGTLLVAALSTLFGFYQLWHRDPFTGVETAVVFISIGGGLALFSLLFDVIAHGSLGNAVREYNTAVSVPRVGFHLNIQPTISTMNTPVGQIPSGGIQLTF